MGRIGASLVLVCAAIAGCSDSPEGVLLVITADQELQADKLRVAFVTDSDDDVVYAFPVNSELVQFRDTLGDFGLTGFGDLHKEPFRYFLRGEISEPTEILVVAARLKDDPNITYDIGASELTVQSEPGVVRQYQVHLERRPSLLAVDSCFHFFDEERDVVVSFDGDLDCDGAIDDDCNPFDGRIHPEAVDLCEVGEPIDNDCDGFCDEDESTDDNNRALRCGTLVDNPRCVRSCGPQTSDAVGEICDGEDTDCNPLTLPHMSAAPCFPSQEDQCFYGIRACTDFDEIGAVGDCMPISQLPLPESFCSAQQECDGDSSSNCIFDNLELPLKTVHCQLPVTRIDKKACPSEVIVRSSASQGACELKVFDVRSPADGGFLEAEGCFGKLTLARPDALVEGSFELLLEQNSEFGGLEYARVIVDAFEVDDCGGTSIGGCFGPIDF